MVQQTLREMFNNYAQKQGVFMDKNVLSHNYIPEATFHREQQVRSLADIISPAMKGLEVSNCFLYGKTGTGKTVVARNVTSELEKTGKNVKVLYVNCKMKRVSDTEYRLLAELCRMLGREVPPTGLPTDAVYSMFYDAVEGIGGNVILILDEIDALVNKIGDEILYNLTRMNQRLSRTKVSMIGISNSISFVESLDPRVRSTLSEEELIFPPYNSTQLKDILKQRADMAFAAGALKPGVIEKCSALAAQEHGDARKALDLLRIAGEIAERGGSKTVGIEHVDTAEDKLDTDRMVEIVRSQPKQSLAVLASVMKLMEPKHECIQTGDVFAVYEKLCPQAGLKMLTQRRVSDLIAELDMLGVISTSVISKGRYGRTREIRMTLPSPVIGKIRNILRENYLL
jgi:cell division control protein 6